MMTWFWLVFSYWPDDILGERTHGKLTFEVHACAWCCVTCRSENWYIEDNKWSFQTPFCCFVVTTPSSSISLSTFLLFKGHRPHPWVYCYYFQGFTTLSSSLSLSTVLVLKSLQRLHQPYPWVPLFFCSRVYYAFIIPILKYCKSSQGFTTPSSSPSLSTVLLFKGLLRLHRPHPWLLFFSSRVYYAFIIPILVYCPSLQGFTTSSSSPSLRTVNLFKGLLRLNHPHFWVLFCSRVNYAFVIQIV